MLHLGLPGRNARSKRWLTPELKRTILDGQCLKRFIEPEEVAILVAFLASDDAKSCKNQTFIIDAGWAEAVNEKQQESRAET